MTDATPDDRADSMDEAPYHEETKEKPPAATGTSGGTGDHPDPDTPPEDE